MYGIHNNIQICSPLYCGLTKYMITKSYTLYVYIRVLHLIYSYIVLYCNSCNEITGFSYQKYIMCHRKNFVSQFYYKVKFHFHISNTIDALHSGIAKGVMRGGNLSIFCLVNGWKGNNLVT